MENFQKNGPKIGETVFTMFLFFKRDLTGREYTAQEIKLRKHVKPFPSYDYINTRRGFTITNHQKGIAKFRNKIRDVIATDSLISGYIRVEKNNKYIKITDEESPIITFGDDGVFRYLFFPEFDQYKNTLKKLIKNVTVVTPATQVMPMYNNINSPEKQKYEKRMQLYQNSSQRLTDTLRTQIGT